MTVALDVQHRDTFAQTGSDRHPGDPLLADRFVSEGPRTGFRARLRAVSTRV